MRRSSKRKWDDCTKLNSIEKLHRWEVNNFVELYNENSHWKFGLESNHFSPLNNEMLEFSAILPPRSTEEDGKEYLPIIIYPWKIPKSLEGKITMKMIISIVGTKTYCRGKLKHCFKRTTSPECWLLYIFTFTYKISF